MSVTFVCRFKSEPKIWKKKEKKKVNISDSHQGSGRCEHDLTVTRVKLDCVNMCSPLCPFMSPFRPFCHGPARQVLYFSICLPIPAIGSHLPSPLRHSPCQGYPKAASGLCDVTSCPLQHRVRPPPPQRHLFPFRHVQLFPREGRGRSQRHV